MAERPIALILTYFGTLLASPTAFLIVLIYAALWFVFERDTFDWHAIATLATWPMTLVIQRSEHRDTQAIHAKLDEVLRALEGAQTGLAKIDDEEPEDIEKYRQRVKDGDCRTAFCIWISGHRGASSTICYIRNFSTSSPK
jgi:low affinity Fe/Cu permease